MNIFIFWEEGYKRKTLTVFNFTKLKGVEKIMNNIVRPGKVYLIMSIACFIGIIMFAIGIKTENSQIYNELCFGLYFPTFLICGIWGAIFYSSTKIVVEEEEIRVQLFGKGKKVWKYTDISEVRIYDNQGISRPILLLSDKNKIVKIVSAYEGYYMFNEVLKLKCGDKIKYIG